VNLKALSVTLGAITKQQIKTTSKALQVWAD